MSEETLKEAIQKTNFHSLFKQLMADAKHNKHREFNFKVEDPETTWIIQVRKKYQNVFALVLDKLSLINQSYVYTDHRLSLYPARDENDGGKWKLSFNFCPCSDTGNTFCMMVPSQSFDCDTFFKDLRKTLFWED